MTAALGRDLPASFYRALHGSPFALQAYCWPEVRFYNKQREIIRSVEDNVETIVVAGNKLGKDYVAGFIVLETFLRHPECRIITTSVRDDHLRVLWGEINRYVQTSRVPLDSKLGGPLLVNHHDLRRLRIKDGSVDPISYVRGIVSQKGEGMAGHHAAWTLFVGDEASGLDDEAYVQAKGWAKRVLLFGNPNPAQNVFFRAVQGGDILATT